MKIENNMLRETRKARFQPSFLIQILIFLGVFFVTQLIAGIIPSVVWIVDIIKNIQANEASVTEMERLLLNLSQVENMPIHITIVMLYATGIATVLTTVYCRFLEKRSLKSMGFFKQKWILRYFIGWLVGFGLFSVAVIFTSLLGGVESLSLNPQIPWGLVAVFFGGFLIQGMSEEVILRGYFMMSLTNKTKMIWAIIINSVIFSLLHIINPNPTFIALLNIAIFGVFASLYTLYTDNIWGVSAVHSAWNFVQGNFYGFEVSGLKLSTSIFEAKVVEGKQLLHGGVFGMEGGLMTTIVLSLACGGLGFLLWRKSQKVKKADLS